MFAKKVVRASLLLLYVGVLFINMPTFTVAVDALKGTVLWESHSDVALKIDEKPLPLPMAKRGQTSFARRRSSVARHSPT